MENFCDVSVIQSSDWFNEMVVEKSRVINKKEDHEQKRAESLHYKLPCRIATSGLRLATTSGDD